jgi:hypothetical protein
MERAAVYHLDSPGYIKWTHTKLPRLHLTVSMDLGFSRPLK